MCVEREGGEGSDGSVLYVEGKERGFTFYAEEGGERLQIVWLH